MAKKKAKAIVIDADVARAAGGREAKHPIPKKCRDFLLTFFKTPHKLAMSPAIRDEWNKHQSTFARKWRTSMVAKGKFTFKKPPQNTELETQLLANLNTAAKKQAASKDFHLIEAALICDKSVVSLDEKVRALFTTCAKNVPKIKSIVWVNPTKDEETPLQWLREGALPEDHRQL